MITCDDCGKDIHGTHVYYKDKNRCWKCDGKLNKEAKEDEK